MGGCLSKKEEEQKVRVSRIRRTQTSIQLDQGHKDEELRKHINDIFTQYELDLNDELTQSELRQMLESINERTKLGVSEMEIKMMADRLVRESRKQGAVDRE